MQIAACLPAILEKDGQHDGVELVVPLLRVVVHAADELAEAHVVCLRGGGRVSSGEGRGSRQVPNGGRLIWILVFWGVLDSVA